MTDIGHKISELTELAGASIASNDELEIRDVSAGTNGTKRVTVASLATGIAAQLTGLVLTKTTTVPSAWILAHSADFALFEIVPAVADKQILPLGGCAKLVFNSIAYTGAVTDMDIILALGVDNGDNPASILGAIPRNFWDAVANATVTLYNGDYTTDNRKPTLNTALKMYLNSGAGVADGDSDVEITVAYLLV